MHSVNPCVTNTGGTLLSMSGLNQVLGLEDCGRAVRVHAGCKMAALYSYLAKHDLELSFCPEIGDATVGSLCVCTSKDSSIDGPGYLSALLLEVKYVDEVSFKAGVAARGSWTRGDAHQQALLTPPLPCGCRPVARTQDGAVVTLTRSKTPSELVEFTCSYGERLSRG
jgi:hypothetical protein